MGWILEELEKEVSGIQTFPVKSLKMFSNWEWLRDFVLSARFTHKELKHMATKAFCSLSQAGW